MQIEIKFDRPSMMHVLKIHFARAFRGTDLKEIPITNFIFYIFETLLKWKLFTGSTNFFNT